MEKETLLNKCHVNSNGENDKFVGIRGEDGDISVCFPLGYRLGGDDKLVRKDIVNLISVLNAFTDKSENPVPEDSMRNQKTVQFPIVAYMRIILHYLDHGCYHENEIRYKTAKRGKINWSRTIKTQKTYPQGKDVFYLDYIVKENTVNQDNLISLIHEYCVYESFSKLGWMYTSIMPPKPRIKFNKKIFRSVIYEKMAQTFNDKTRELFQSMLDMINSMGNDGSSKKFQFGTDRFEYVWERMIDYVYGIEGKERYFPRTAWHLVGQEKENNALEPDTIMIVGDMIYVLDAKYYKYGATGIPAHLPESTSINKQITYGEYIAENSKFKEVSGKGLRVYNAFIMPFSKDSKYFKTKEDLFHIGEAVADWKKSKAEYERVQGVLLDVKHIMHNHFRMDESEIKKLAELIMHSVSDQKKRNEEVSELHQQ